MWIYCIFIFLWIFKLDISAPYDTGPVTYYTDSCDENGAYAIACEDNHVIRVTDVRCMPYNYTCPERPIITRLCDGLSTCNNIDIRRQLDTHCRSYPDKKVFISFQCIPDHRQPFCRTNICSPESADIRCRRDKVIHLLKASCYEGNQDCPAFVYMAIYNKCQSQRVCILGEIRQALPHNSVCAVAYRQQQNIFMDYICVDEKVISDKCTGGFVRQVPRFGIIQNPGYPDNPVGSKDGCYWAIYRESGQITYVTIHLSFSKEGLAQCNSQFLQVQYTLCDTKEQTTDRFCDEGRINVEIRSCGTVFVIHYAYSAGNDRGNRFLISYSVENPSSDIRTYEPFASQCDRPLLPIGDHRNIMTFAANNVTTTTTTTMKPGLTSVSEEQPINDSSVSEQEVEPTKDNKDKLPAPTNPWRMVELLLASEGVVVVNIFLGLLIIALIMALAFVCYRYRTYGRDKSRSASKSNTATTLDGDKNSTHMQLLSGDDDKISNKVSSGGLSPADADQDTSHVCTSFTVISPVETTIFHFNRPSSVHDDDLFHDSELGVSSFLPHPPLRRGNGKNQNTESAYSSLDGGDEGLHNLEIAEVNETKTEENLNLSPLHQVAAVKASQQSLAHAPNMKHYKVNDDEYALVCKTTNNPNGQPVDVHQCSGSECSEARSSVSERSFQSERGVSNPLYSQTLPLKVKYSNKPVAHIHPVPEETHNCDRSTPTTMHVIPEHDCLLHKIPPPPPPAKLPSRHQQANHWDSPQRQNSPSWSSHSSQNV